MLQERAAGLVMLWQDPKGSRLFQSSGLSGLQNVPSHRAPGDTAAAELTWVAGAWPEPQRETHRAPLPSVAEAPAAANLVPGFGGRKGAPMARLGFAA